MKKPALVLTTIVLSLLCFAEAAYSWGGAVHAFLAEQYSAKNKLTAGNQIYGGFTPDIFNFRFDAPEYMAYLYGQTHNNAMQVWDAARSKPEQALALGFVSHNELWGADFTAHRSGITFGQLGSIPGKPNEGGYIIAKAYLLKAMLEQDPVYNALQLPDAVSLEVAHNLVEYGVDILMKNLDPQIGSIMIESAHQPNPAIPLLLQKAYAADFSEHFGIRSVDALMFMRSSEQDFRTMMTFYGQALMQDDTTSVLLLSEQLAQLAAQFLASYGIALPPGVDIAPLLQSGIMLSMMLCANDFGAEVLATAGFVDQQLVLHGISY